MFKAPECSVVGLEEKLLLFRHEPNTEQILQKLTEKHDIRDGDLLEVVLAGQSFQTHTRSIQSILASFITADDVDSCQSC